MARLLVANPYLLCAIVFALLCGVTMRVVLHDPLFWDARVYTSALAIFQGGGDAYLEAANFGFVYPPVFLFAHGFLSAIFPSRLGWGLYGLVMIVSAVSIPWLLATQYIRVRWFTPQIAFALFVLQPRLLAEIGLLSGNLATPLYALTLAAGVPGLRRNRWLPFCFVVALSATVKPQYLLFLLLPLLAGTRQIWQSVVTVPVAGFGYLAQRLAMPTLFQHFQRAVAVQVLGKGDVGFGIFSYFFKILHRSPLAEAGHVIVLGTLIGTLILLRSRAQSSPLWIPLLIVTIILGNPRLLSYDAQVAVLPALLLCVETGRFIVDSDRNIIWVTLPAAALLVLFSMDGRAGVCLLLVAAIASALATFATRRETDGLTEPNYVNSLSPHL